MAWTAPMTAVANAVFTAAQFNTHVRDNLLETAPAKATTAGGYFVATGANAIAQRLPASDTVNASEATTSTSYTDLSTSGPAVTVTTGTSALVIVTAEINCGTDSQAGMVSWATSGATTVAANNDTRLRQEATVAGGNEFFHCSYVFRQTGLTAGSNTFTLKYAVSGGGATATFNKRHLTVIPF